MKCLHLFAACLLPIAYAAAAEFHVSPNGCDDNPATADAPVQSLERARDLAREARRVKPDEAVNILLHPGIYTIRSTVEFTKDDCGTEAAPLVIRAWHNPKSPVDWPTLVGGVVVEDWKKSDFTNEALASSGLQVYEADLAPLGIERKFRQIYLDGARQIWARYPNYDPALPYSGGWAYVAGERRASGTRTSKSRSCTSSRRNPSMEPW